MLLLGGISNFEGIIAALLYIGNVCGGGKFGSGFFISTNIELVSIFYCLILSS